MQLGDELFIPSDTDAERRVVGSLILDPAQVADVSAQLTQDDFVFQPYWHVLRAASLLDAAHDPVSPATIVRHLSGQKAETGGTLLDACGGADGIARMLEGVLPEELAYWTGRVKAKHKERVLLEIAADMRKLSLSSPENIQASMAEFEERMSALSGSTAEHGAKPMSATLGALDDRLQRYLDHPDEVTGLPTGYKRLDELTDGAQPGNCTILYAPSSRYKSLVVTNIGLRHAQAGHMGVWFTTEMQAVQINERVLSLVSGLNLRWLKRDKKIEQYEARLRAARDMMSQLPIMIEDSAITMNALRAEVMRQARWRDAKYVIVDLVDLVETSQYRDDTVAQQSYLMRQMKRLAKAANVHIYLVSHVSKGDRALRQSAELDMEDMKGSSSKYQDVDCAISIMPVYHDPESGEWKGMTRPQIQDTVEQHGIITVMLSLTKNRHGETGRILFQIDFLQGGLLSECR